MRANKRSQYFLRKIKAGGKGLHVLRDWKRRRWSPPVSPFGLIQEKLFKDPWKLLVATIFLNKTNAKVALPLLDVFFKTYPTPEAILVTEEPVLAALLQPMGLNNTRAHKLKRFTQEFLNKEWTRAADLYGIGKYGEDSYRLFCLGEWKTVCPEDKKLNKYHKWLLESVKSGALTL